MLVSQKCQYALRALFELAKRADQGPVKTSQIAMAQAIPQRFLEVILSQLKQGGFVTALRGNAGGYYLARPAREITVGEVIRYIEGPLGPVQCLLPPKGPECPLTEDCVFLPMWKKVQKAIEEIYDSTDFQSLVDDWRSRAERYVPYYSI